jgi:drug/metabolite transporter superfamily protein YnfA
MDSFDKFKRKQEITRFSDNYKMFVVGVLVFSVIVFTIIGDEQAKLLLWDWVAVMVALVGTMIILDIINYVKIKREGL